MTNARRTGIVDTVLQISQGYWKMVLHITLFHV